MRRFERGTRNAECGTERKDSCEASFNFNPEPTATAPIAYCRILLSP
jgi:hypothetical protein